MTALKALAGLTKLKASAAALAGPDLPRVMANVAFSGTSLVVFACLAYSLDARRYASVGVVYVATSVATNLLRYGIFDATLAGQLDLERCRKAAQLVATVAVVGAVVVALGATIGFAGGFAPDSPLVIGAYLGSALALSADLARMLRLCDGRARFVMWGDVAWLGATMVGALVSSTAGGSLADGAVGGWVAGALVWTALVFRPRTSRSTLDGLRALAASSSMAVSGTGPFIGYLLGLVFVGALGQPAAVSVMDVGRLVGMPAITIYSGLRIGLVSRSTGDARSPLVISLVTSLALVSLTVLCVAVAPLGADSALSAAQRYWPLIWAGQAARLVTGIIGDVVRPRMPARAGVRLGALSMTLGALVPPALVWSLGERGGPLSQAVVALLLGAYSVWVLSLLAPSSVPLRRRYHINRPHLRPATGGVQTLPDTFGNRRSGAMCTRMSHEHPHADTSWLSNHTSHAPPDQP